MKIKGKCPSYEICRGRGREKRMGRYRQMERVTLQEILWFWCLKKELEYAF